MDTLAFHHCRPWELANHSGDSNPFVHIDLTDDNIQTSGGHQDQAYV